MNELTVLFPHNTAFQKPQKAVRVLGIDLGTTNSTVAEAIWDPNESTPATARCLEVDQFTFDGQYTNLLVPSFVAIVDGKTIIGEGAKRLRAEPSKYALYKNLFYQCKNDIGTRRTYHMAPEGFRSAAEIGGKVLEFLIKAAMAEDEAPVTRTVVTVPASFQAAQRNDTLKAALSAGLDLTGGDLLDEPVAAFLDYLVSNRDKFLSGSEEPKNLVVFDFGGGTCDVAVFAVEFSNHIGHIGISPLAVSRYHRLGGGDIDTAILYDILIPQFRTQNGLSEFDLSFEEKKKYIEPSLLGAAESLKISLCSEIARRLRFNKYNEADKSSVRSQLPGVHHCKLKDRTLTLQSPQITAEQFEKLLEPFLDQDLLYARETEYRMTCSIFAPLQDALDRSETDVNEIDYCLMVGGSSLIPQVIEAVSKFFPKAEILTYPDKDSIQTSVARGAAYHALALAVCGKGLLQPVCHDDISIRAESGLVKLVPKGTNLPYPADGSYARSYALAVSETKMFEEINLRVEIIGGQEERPLVSVVWKIEEGANRGDALCLEYRYDENQILDLRIKLADNEGAASFEAAIENPLTNVVNPQSTRIKIDEIEEDLRTKKIPDAKILETFVELAEGYADLRQHEKALDYLKKVLQSKKRPDPEILNKMGIYCGEMGDFDRQEKFYREAAAASSWSGPLFNLALAQKRRRRLAEAVESIDKALARDRQAPYLVLRAMLAESLGDSKGRKEFLDEALRVFDPVSALNDWELGWFITAAHMVGDQEMVEKAQAEQKKRSRQKDRVSDDQGQLPILAPNLQRRAE